MNPWLLAALGLLAPWIVAVIASCRGDTSARLVAIQFAVSITVFLLVVLEFVFAQPSSLALALAVALLGLPGTLVLVLFRERWL